MTDALGVNVCERAEKLVNVKLDFKRGHGGLELVEEPRGAVDGFGDEFEDQIEIDLILLGSY